MVFPENYPALARERAEELYLNNKYNCVEAAFLALLESCGENVAPETLRVITGLGGGIGRAGCACGALLGCVVGASYFFGRTDEENYTSKTSYQISQKIHDTFREHNKATCCRILSKGLLYGSPEQRRVCALRTAEIVELTAQIIMDAVSSENEKQQ